MSGLGVVGIWVGLAAFRAPKGARTLLGIWVALSWLGTFRVSGLGVVGIWVGGGSIPGACRRPDAAGDLGKLCGWLGTFIVSGLGVVGIWAWSGSISGRQDETRRGGPPACLVVAPNAAGDLGTFK